VLQFFVTEPNQSFQRGLVFEPVLAAELEYFCVNVTLGETEDVCIRPALNLAEIALFTDG